MMMKTLTALSALGLVIAMQAMPASAQVNIPSAKELAASEFGSPQYVQRSWGLLHAPADGPQVQYSWAEIERQFAKK